MAIDASATNLRAGDQRMSRADRTRERLLDAAARLFAERGYTGTSIRAVTTAAGVSVSAANYHFGSKRELLSAVCQRLIGPLNQERMRALDEVELRSGPPAQFLEDLLRAFLAPAVLQPPDRQLESRAVAARLYADPPEIVAELKRDLFGPLRDRMTLLLGRALPAASSEQLALAFQFTVGVMVHVVGGHLETGADSDAGYPRDEQLVEALVSYCAAGIRAQALRHSEHG